MLLACFVITGIDSIVTSVIVTCAANICHDLEGVQDREAGRQQTACQLVRGTDHVPSRSQRRGKDNHHVSVIPLSL